MLIGHYAPALVLQRVRPTVKLWQLFVAVQLVDIAWAILVLLGVEHARIVPGFTESNALDLWHMPYTHGLVATAGWALVTFVAWRGLSKAKTRTGDAAVVALAVASHFVGDLLVHVPDLPILAADGPKLGLGLWRHRTVALIVEVGLFAAASLWWWLPRAREPGSRRAAIWLLAMTVFAVTTFYAPPPPSVLAVTSMGLFMYAAFAALAAWAGSVRAAPER